MSDEFETSGRTFTDGGDNGWTAMDKSDDDMSSSGGGSLHFYNSTQVTTSGGFLNVSTEIGETSWTGYDPFKEEYVSMKKTYKSGMVNGWNKFCFTGGIVEIDAIMPGNPTSGGLWPAMWILGNLGRATYEGSTNKIWPWSYDTCDRGLQHAQEISGCGTSNHYGLKPNVGRGSTEIDIIEIMPGEPGFLPSTQPKVERPYAAMTLQVAPGVTNNRPNSGQRPVLVGNDGTNGHPPSSPQTWYPDLGFEGNTTMNPFFYGTWLGETKPEEPTHRTKLEAYQADAVGAMHQMKEAHFAEVHTYRMEWQPGKGGRIDWYVKDTQDDAKERPGGYQFGSKEVGGVKKVKNSDYATPQKASPTGWTHAFSIKDSSLSSTTGAQVPNEPSYLIFNTAVSSTWGFPYGTPVTCKKCYDCSDPACACALPPGFCDSLKDGKTSLLVDSVRVYQEEGKENVGCDPVDMPTREFIKGHEFRYMRPMPFLDKHSLKDVVRGGGGCGDDKECGTGECVNEAEIRFWPTSTPDKTVCKCPPDRVGPHCKSYNFKDDSPGAYDYELDTGWFMRRVASPYVPLPLVTVLLTVGCLFAGSVYTTYRKKQITEGVYRGGTKGEATPRWEGGAWERLEERVKEISTSFTG